MTQRWLLSLLGGAAVLLGTGCPTVIEVVGTEGTSGGSTTGGSGTSGSGGVVDPGPVTPSSCALEPAPCQMIPIPPKQPLISKCSQKFPPAESLPCPVPDSGGPQLYVNAATGNDANDGKSPATAWATLCHATAAAPEGSTLRVAEGDYPSSSVFVNKELTIKGGYDATFSSWDPDLHPSNFYGRLTLDHAKAVWGGFKMLSSSIFADSWSYTHHRIAAGTLVRNYIEIIAINGADPLVLNLTGLSASSCPGGTSAIRCNDIYVRSSAPQAFATDAIEYGGDALHEGAAVVDSNRICQDSGGAATTTIDGYGTCGPAPSSISITNNVIEKSGGIGANAVYFYGCDMADMDITLTNNTILSDGEGIGGGSEASVLRWRLSNNIVFNTGKAGTAINVGSGVSQIAKSQGNLTFGFSNNGISPTPLSGSGDDTSGKAEPNTVFVNFGAGDFHLVDGGQGAGTGINVYGDPELGGVTTDIFQKPRNMTGPWDRGAFAR
jgi:hypothetical protein